MQNKVKLTRTLCQHATDEMFTNGEFAELIGSSMGFIFEAKGHKKFMVRGIPFGMSMLKLKLELINLITVF